MCGDLQRVEGCNCPRDRAWGPKYLDLNGLRDKKPRASGNYLELEGSERA